MRGTVGSVVRRGDADSTSLRRRLTRLLRRHRSKVAVALVASAVSTASLALVPVIQRAVIDDAGRDRSLVVVLLVALVGLGVVRFATTPVRRFVGGRMASDVQLELRNAVLVRLLALDLTQREEPETGQLVARVTSDLSLVQQHLAWAPMVLGSQLQAVLSLAIMAALNVWLTLIALVVPLVTLVSSRTMRSSVFPSSWDAQQREGELTAVVIDAVLGARVVRAYVQERRLEERFQRAAHELFASRLRSVRLRSSVAAEVREPAAARASR